MPEAKEQYAVDPAVKEKSKLGKELAEMAKDIAKVRTLLAEQLSHSHGITNLAEAKRILNKKIAQYEQACKQRLILLDQQEASEIEGLPPAANEADEQLKETAISEIKAKYIKFRQQCEQSHNHKMKSEVDALEQQIVKPRDTAGGKRK